MNSLIKHNIDLREELESGNSYNLKELLDLDTIDTVLRELLTIEEMREAGSFFTGQKLASCAVDSFEKPITFNSVVLDPTCGAGNLLIEASRKLGIETSLSKTLMKWGKVLWGFDIHEHFIEACKLRLIIEALNRGAVKDCDISTSFSYLSNIKLKDALKINESDLSSVTHIIMNPPFTIWSSPQTNYWKKGKVNAAGVILDTYLRLLPQECVISAILPDVLRSGSRYQGFRNFVASTVDGEVNIWGRFNKNTDVDVFILSGSVNLNQKSIAWHKYQHNEKTISDDFHVMIGPLVAYRDKEVGTKYPYFYPKNCPKWEEVKIASEFRQFKGKALKPPLIVIKRTSSPSDKDRAACTLINLKEMVAVENHLIALIPKDGKVRTCKNLVKVLKDKKTSDFLNERIRLRHLTVSVIKDIPIIKDK